MEINSQNFDQLVIKSKLPVLLDLYAPWCGPCKNLSPFIDKLASEFKGRLLVAKLNIDNSPNIPAQFSVRAIPTILFFKGGKLVDKINSPFPQIIYSKINSIL